MSKNVGPFLAFGHEWFALHQHRLLWCLNSPGIGRLMRRSLRINMADVSMPRNTKIVEIAPNHYTVQLPSGEYRSDFRTHPKYAKRVYYSWKTVWWLMHYWDEVFADRRVPALSFGFATLTAYPDPSIEVATTDGYTQASISGTWAELIAAAGGFADHTVTQHSFFTIAATNVPDQWTQADRSIFLFDTSALGGGAVISAAVLSVYGWIKTDTLAAAPTADIYTSNPASNTTLIGTDYSTLGSVSQTGAPIPYASFVTAAYNDFTFNATGISNVSKTGISKFGGRNANYDVAAVAPTWSSFGFTRDLVNFADFAGTTSDPKLVVTYGAAPPASAGGITVRRGRRYWPGFRREGSDLYLPSNARSPMVIA